MPNSDDASVNGRPARKARVTRSPKFWLGTALAVVFLLFVAQNHAKVEVHYIFFTKDSYLIWIMLGCGAIGFVVGWLWGRPARVMSRRSKRDKEAKG